MYRVYRNQAAAAYLSLYFFLSNFQHCPFVSSFFFLSNCQTLEFFVTLFSGTGGPRRLKPGTHIDSGQIYRVYRNQAPAAYSSLYFFIFFSLQLSNIKNFGHNFPGTVKSLRLKFDTHVDSGQMCYVYRNQAAAAYLSLYVFIFLSLQVSNINIFRHTLLTNCEA